jgi:hypothetical protein
MGFRYLLLGNRYLMPFRSRADRVARLRRACDPRKVSRRCGRSGGRL